MSELAIYIQSPAFLARSRHSDCPTAFTRERKLPFVQVIAALLSARSASVQAMLDTHFACLHNCADLIRVVSDRAFAKARDKLHIHCMQHLNDWIMERCESMGLIARWQGLRLVAADASVFMPSVRPCLLKRHAAAAEQQLFGLYLPGAELMLHACLHPLWQVERQMLFEELQRLHPTDLLLLDRGYPASWLVNVLSNQGVQWCMRCDNTRGGRAIAQFMRSSKQEDWVQLKAPKASHDADYCCGTHAPRVRLIGHISPNGQVRVLMTNLTQEQYPAHLFGDLYHQRWRVEEAFKRMKLRLKIESVCGMSGHAVQLDVQAKMVADNLSALLCMAAGQKHDLQERQRVCNRTYACNVFSRIIGRVVGTVQELTELLWQVIENLGKNTHKRVPNRSQPRHHRRDKPHQYLAYRGG